MGHNLWGVGLMLCDNVTGNRACHVTVTGQRDKSVTSQNLSRQSRFSRDNRVTGGGYIYVSIYPLVTPHFTEY
jgi:hypothetical protein